MPNWTSKELIVTGKHDEVARFVDHIGQTMDFENIIPPPANMFRGDLLGEKERKECAEKGIPNWYDWQSEHWGTKWNAFDVEREICEYGDEVKYTFGTAWDAPRKILIALKEQYPQLSFRWFYRIEGWEACGFLHEEV